MAALKKSDLFFQSNVEMEVTFEFVKGCLYQIYNDILESLDFVVA